MPAQTTIDGLLDVLDKASRSNSSDKLQNATDDIHNAIDDAKTDLEDDTNILNIDSSADLQSVTSSMNPTPSSLQFILRTQEISTDDDADAVTSDQDAADEGVLARIVNIFQEARKRDLRRICFQTEELNLWAYRLQKGQEKIPVLFFLSTGWGIIA